MISLAFSHTDIDGSGNKSHYFDVATFIPFSFSTKSSRVIIEQQPGGYYLESQWDDVDGQGPFGSPRAPYDAIYFPFMLDHLGGDIYLTALIRHIYIPDGAAWNNPALRPRYSGIMNGLPDDIATRLIPLNSYPVLGVSRRSGAPGGLSSLTIFDGLGGASDPKKANEYVPETPLTPEPTTAQVGHYTQKNYQCGVGTLTDIYPPWVSILTFGNGSKGTEQNIAISGYVITNPEYTVINGYFMLNRVPYRTYNIFLPSGEIDLGGEVDYASIIHDPTL